MMREYAKLSPTFWTGETGKALRKRGSEAVIVALYLVSAPGSNMLGLYYQPILYMAHETGLGINGATKGLQACIEVGFCEYDGETEMVFVKEMAAWQIADDLKPNDLRCRGIQKDYDALPDNPFLEAWYLRYCQAFHLTNRRVGSREPTLFDEPPKQGPTEAPSQAPLQAPSKPGAGTGAGTGAGAGTPVGVAAEGASGSDPAAGAAATTPTTRGTRLAKDWALPKAWGDWALTEYPLWTPEKVRREAAAFRDHWCAKAGKEATKVDWLATWRNWCRSELAHRDDPKPGRTNGAAAVDTAARDAEARRLLGFGPANPSEVIDA